MKKLNLKNIHSNTSSNIEGGKLFKELVSAKENGDQLILQVDSELALSSSFLNTSIGLFLEQYGVDHFKKTVKFQGSRNQFERLSSYIKQYSNLFLTA